MQVMENRQEQYRAMFGEEAQGYAPERVEAYLGKLETAYQKLLEKHDAATRLLAERQERVSELERENERLLRQVDTAEQAAAVPFEQSEPDSNEIGQILLDARRAGDQIIEDAKVQAEQMVAAQKEQQRVLAQEARQLWRELNLLHREIGAVIRRTELDEPTGDGTDER